MSALDAYVGRRCSREAACEGLRARDDASLIFGAAVDDNMASRSRFCRWLRRGAIARRLHMQDPLLLALLFLPLLEQLLVIPTELPHLVVSPTT